MKYQGRYKPCVLILDITCFFPLGIDFNWQLVWRCYQQKQKYRGMFETQKSRNKTSSGDIGLNIRTLASPKVGQEQVSGGVSVLCWLAALVATYDIARFCLGSIG